MTPSFPVNPALVAAPQTLVGLHDAIKGRLSAVAAGFQLKTKSGATRPPTVVDGWLAPKDGSLNAEQFPFLIVRPRTGTDTEQSADQNAIAAVNIIIGTYSDTDDGWKDVALLIGAIRKDFAEAPTIVGTAFEQTGPLTWEIDQQQPRPQWFGEVKSIWTLPRPVRVESLNPQPEES